MDERGREMHDGERRETEREHKCAVAEDEAMIQELHASKGKMEKAETADGGGQ